MLYLADFCTYFVLNDNEHLWHSVQCTPQSCLFSNEKKVITSLLFCPPQSKCLLLHKLRLRLHHIEQWTNVIKYKMGKKWAKCLFFRFSCFPRHSSANIINVLSYVSVLSDAWMHIYIHLFQIHWLKKAQKKRNRWHIFFVLFTLLIFACYLPP